MNKILIVCQSEKLSSKLCYALSEKLNYMVLNVNDYLKYELYNKEDIENILGMEYYKNKEVKIISNLISFENCIIEVTPKMFLQERFNSILTKIGKTVFIKISKTYIENEIKLENDQQIKNILNMNLTVFNEIQHSLENVANQTILYNENKLDEKEIISVINQISF